MQQSLSIEPLPQFASQQADSSTDTQPSSTGQPVCGAFDGQTFLILGCSSGSVSCLHLGRYGSAARRILGRHAGRVTSACLLPWQPPAHIAAAATVVPCARTASFFATSSADATIKLWTSDAKALHTTDACLQTLRGHRAAVTSLAAVQVSHTWCLLSGGTDGQILLWRAESPPEASDQQLSGAAMLAQLVPHMRLTEAALYSSPHWVVGVAAPVQQTDAGVDQGAYVALAQQPLLQVPISRSAVAETAAALASSAVTAQQQYRGSTPSGSRVVLPQSPPLQPSRLSADAASSAPSAAHQGSRFAPTACANTSSSTTAAKHNIPTAVQQCAGAGSTAGRTACSSPSSTKPAAQYLQRPGSANSSMSSSYISSSCYSPAGAGYIPKSPPAVCEVHGTHLSISSVKFVLQQLAVMTLAYDGACRLHSAAEGVTRCCWRSPTGSCYTAADVCTGPDGQVVLLGDDRGCLHLYSLTSEKMLASKQLATSRITAIISCDTTPPTATNDSSSGGSGSSDNGSGSGSGSSRRVMCVQFAVLSEDGVGLWQLRPGNSHGIVPGGHRQAVLVLQYCNNTRQVPLPEFPPHPTARSLTKTDSTSSRCSQQPTLFGMTGQSCDTQPPPDKACSSGSTNGERSSIGEMRGSSGGGCGSSSGGLLGSSSGCGSSDSSCPGPMLMSAGLDGRVIQWDLSGGGPAAVQSVLATAGADAGSELTAMAHLQVASILVTGHDNGQILLWNMDTGSHAVLGPQAHTNSVSYLTPATTVKGDEQLVSAGFDGWVCLWEPRQVRGIKPHLIARFQANGCRPSSPRPLHSPQHHHQQHAVQHFPKPGSAASSSSSSYGRPVSGSYAASAYLGWGVGREQPVFAQRASSPCTAAGKGSPSSTRPSSSMKQAAGAAGRSCSTACSSGTCDFTCRNCSGSSSRRGVPSGGLSGSSGVASSGGSRGSDRVHAAEGLDVLAAVQEAPPEVLVVLFEPLNQVIITGGNDGLVKVWVGGASGQLLGQHVGHTGPVNCLALDGNLLFSGSLDTTIRMWDVLPPGFGSSHGSTTSRPVSFGVAVAALAAAPAGGRGGSSAGPGCNNSRTAASSKGVRPPCKVTSTTATSTTSRAPSTATSTAFAVLRGHTASVTGLAVATDTGVLVSCGADGQLLQWDYCMGQLLARYSLEGQSLTGVAVEPDTRLVYVANAKGQLLTVPGTELVVGADGDAVSLKL